MTEYESEIFYYRVQDLKNKFSGIDAPFLKLMIPDKTNYKIENKIEEGRIIYSKVIEIYRDFHSSVTTLYNHFSLTGLTSDCYFRLTKNQSDVLNREIEKVKRAKEILGMPFI
jgi:hypothetical protein